MRAHPSPPKQATEADRGISREGRLSELTISAWLAKPQKNFGRPVEWAMVKEHPWSTPQLRRLDTPASPWTSCPLQTHF